MNSLRRLRPFFAESEKVVLADLGANNSRLVVPGSALSGLANSQLGHAFIEEVVRRKSVRDDELTPKVLYNA
jgi:hypothetical protein